MNAEETIAGLEAVKADLLEHGWNQGGYYGAEDVELRRKSDQRVIDQVKASQADPSRRRLRKVSPEVVDSAALNELAAANEAARYDDGDETLSRLFEAAAAVVEGRERRFGQR